MLRFFNKRLHNRKGFTLIELIVVIAILAILALIAIPRLGGFTENAKQQTDVSNAKLLETTAAVYYSSTGAYPATLSVLTTDSADGKYNASIDAIPEIESVLYGGPAGDFEDLYDATTGKVTLP